MKPALSWDESTDPDGSGVTYDLYFDEAQDNLSVKASDLETNSYTFTEVLNYETTYYWKVMAKDGQGGQTEGPVWNFATMLKSPSNLSAKLDAAQITLSWQDNSNNEDGFIIERKIGDSTEWEEIEKIEEADIEEYINTNLTRNTTYSYRVKVFSDLHGFSDYSNIATETMGSVDEWGPPDQPFSSSSP